MLAAFITFWLGIYFAFRFVPPAVSVFGAEDVFIFWGLDRITSGLAECVTTSRPLNCVFDLVRLTTSIPSLPVRLTICFLGAVLAAASFQWFQGSRDDNSKEVE